VRLVGKHVREEAATVMQKWARGASVRLGWDMPGLCDSDGELVVYGQPGSFPIFHSVNIYQARSRQIWLALDEMEEVD
jgi:hypothetical protein